MAILVDYRCGSCGSREEHWAASPPPSTATCGGCGAESSRAWAPIGLAGTSTSTSDVAPARPTGPRRSMCSQYPQVPGLCHMSESAGRMWVAKYRNDGRTIDREQERQETAAAVNAPTMADAITHHHAAPTPLPAG